MLSKLKTALRALLRRSQAERELDEELRCHIEQQTEQNIRLGMTPEEARHAARKTFGGVEQAKERSRDARGVRWLEELWQDLRYGARMLAKYSSFTLIAVITLALGIGVNTALFTMFHLFDRPLPLKKPGAILMVDYREKDFEDNFRVSYPEYLHLQSRTKVFHARMWRTCWWLARPPAKRRWPFEPLSAPAAGASSASYSPRVCCCRWRAELWERRWPTGASRF
jgi:hypothetical protein